MNDQNAHARSHGYSTANANPIRSNLQKPGRFGLLFPELASVPWTTGNPAQDDLVLRELGAAMHVAERKDGECRGQVFSDIPIGDVQDQ